MANSLLIPDDIITDILSRVSSVKSLLRFRCVCKSWQTKISSFSFIKMHLNRSSSKNENYIFHRPETPNNNPNPNPKLVLKHTLSICSAETVKEGSTFSFDLCFTPYNLSTVGSCNGLLCLSSYLCELIYLCNPATREVRRIHDDYPKNKYTSYKVGFGFDPLIDDYKVVQIIYRSQAIRKMSFLNNHGILFDNQKVCGGKSEVRIYRLSTNSWERMGDIIGPEVKIADDWCQVLVNGCIYWMSELSDKNQTRSIITFDLSKEVFRQIILPDICACEKDSMKLGVLWGCFSLLSFDQENDTTEIWVMKEDYSVLDCWTKQIVIKGVANGISSPLGFGNDGKVLMLKNDFLGYDLFWYDLKNQTNKGTDLKYEDYPFFSYVESLVSVKSQ